jgi:hypothetical protein
VRAHGDHGHEEEIRIHFRASAVMQMVKIQIPDKKESARALVEMSGRGRVLCFADDVYIVPEPALALLASLNIRYQELGRGGFDIPLC